MRGIDTSSLTGRTVIEMGCGMGKYVKTIAGHAALAVGLDLSHSLERARENTRGLTNVLLVQGNILEPPFRPGTFDYVYSVGVLHHTPDCRMAFKRSAALVAPGGRFSVWLYPTERQSAGLYAARGAFRAGPRDQARHLPLAARLAVPALPAARTDDVLA